MTSIAAAKASHPDSFNDPNDAPIAQRPHAIVSPVASPERNATKAKAKAKANEILPPAPSPPSIRPAAAAAERPVEAISISVSPQAQNQNHRAIHHHDGHENGTERVRERERVEGNENTSLTFEHARAMAADPAAEALSQWMFSEEEIENSLSVQDGLTPEEERARRAKGVNFIIQAAILLKIPQVTIAAASVFFQRFYMRCSMVVEKGGLHHYVSVCMRGREMG
jgi:hypothetical protein